MLAFFVAFYDIIFDNWGDTMGKLSNMMYMIDLLNTGNIYTLKELSENNELP